MAEERSQSRGREPMMSTGRGGAGNIRSLSRDARTTVDDGVTASVERGRGVRDHSLDKVHSSGRGGAGNIRSPSRDPAGERRNLLDEEALEAQKIRERRIAEQGAPHSSGRGGAGNISSRSPSATREGHEHERGRGEHHHLGPVDALKETFRNFSRSKSRDRTAPPATVQE